MEGIVGVGSHIISCTSAGLRDTLLQSRLHQVSYIFHLTLVTILGQDKAEEVTSPSGSYISLVYTAIPG